MLGKASLIVRCHTLVTYAWLSLFLPLVPIAVLQELRSSSPFFLLVMGLSGSDGVILAVVLISVALSIYAISMCYYIVVYKPAQKERELKVKVTEYLVKNDLDRLNEQVIQQLDALHIQEDTDLNELDHIMRTLATIDHNTEMQRHERAVMMPDQQRVQLQHLQILSSAIKVTVRFFFLLVLFILCLYSLC